MDLHLPTVYRSGLLGVTSGARSFSGLAAQVLVTPSLERRQPERALGHLRAKGLVSLAALGELVGDKLPMAPSRLTPLSLLGRLGLAAVTALLVARAEDAAERAADGPTAYEQGPAEASLPPGGPAPALPSSALVAVPVAVAASLASTFLGYAWRGWASRAFGRDWPGAVLEDAAAITIAVVATRR